MSKKITITPNSMLVVPIAFYLGYTFFDLFLKSFVADSLAMPGILLCGVAFMLVMRWLGAETPQASRIKTKGFTIARCATVPKVFALWEASTTRYQAKSHNRCHAPQQKLS